MKKFPFLFLLFTIHSLFVFGQEKAKVHNIRYYSSSDYTRVVIDIDKIVAFTEKKLIEPNRVRIYFDIDNAKIYNLPPSIPVSKGFIKEIRVGQFTFKTARVVLEFAEVVKYRTFVLYSPFRIVVDIYGARKIVPKISPATKEGELTIARQLGLGVKKIVIDPGHGGEDPGAIGPNGITEEEIVLDIALKLKELLERNSDIKVILTRDRDVYVPLEVRTAIANSERADLFISIHANSTKNRNVSGIEVYTLNFTKDPHAIEIAASENAVSSKTIGELEALIKKILLNTKKDESVNFAKFVEKGLRNQTSIRSLGVKVAPFYVLIGAEMPSILVEVGFLSHPIDREKLSKSTFRAEVAKGLFSGILDYISSFGKPSM
ncbi:MAG: N-acetylmuramoyl-L-alanine amidase [Candidatus Aminicenantia bacterium]